MDDFKTENWTLNDGRRAERRVMESKSENGHSERVVELHIEDERPLRLQQRVVEKSKPIVYERKLETVDPKTGEVIEQKIESIEPKSQMQLVDHIVSSSKESIVSSQSVKEDFDCHVTKEEMIETIVAAIKAIREPQISSMPNENFTDQLNSLGLAEEIKGRVEKGMSTKDLVLMGIILAQVAGLVYIIFFM